MGSMEHYEKQIRGFVITKHNTLFYRVEDTRLVLLHFLITGRTLKRNRIKANWNSDVGKSAHVHFTCARQINIY